MEKTQQFKITYYSNKDKKHITRHCNVDDKCKFWTSKQGAKLMTYFDMDKHGDTELPKAVGK